MTTLERIALRNIFMNACKFSEVFFEWSKKGQKNESNMVGMLEGQGGEIAYFI